MDLLPNNTTSTVIGSKFDPITFTERDIEIALKIRNIKIQLELAIQRYEVLFGEKYVLEDVKQYLPNYVSLIKEE